jgi:hypothetical protein
MSYVTLLLFLTYVASLVIHVLVPAAADILGNVSLGLELALDASVFYLAARLAGTEYRPDLRPEHFADPTASALTTDTTVPSVTATDTTPLSVTAAAPTTPAAKATAVALPLTMAPATATAWDGLAFRLVQWSFLSTILSTTNFQILSHAFGVVLSKTQGTWLELEINLPYLAFFALGAAALFVWVKRLGPDASKTLPWALGFAFTAFITALMLPGLNATGFPLQNRLLRVLCFVVAGGIFGSGVYLLAFGKGLAVRLLTFGYLSMTLSGLLFQVTEISRGAYRLDLVLDLTWTLGQFLVILGLLRFARAITEAPVAGGVGPAPDAPALH